MSALIGKRVGTIGENTLWGTAIAVYDTLADAKELRGWFAIQKKHGNAVQADSKHPWVKIAVEPEGVALVPLRRVFADDAADHTFTAECCDACERVAAGRAAAIKATHDADEHGFNVFPDDCPDCRAATEHYPADPEAHARWRERGRELRVDPS